MNGVVFGYSRRPVRHFKYIFEVRRLCVRLCKLSVATNFCDQNSPYKKKVFVLWRIFENVPMYEDRIVAITLLFL